MMVVVPTDTSVELTYGRTGVDYVSLLLTLLGVVLCLWWRRQGDLDVSAAPSGRGSLDHADEVSAEDGSDESDGLADATIAGSSPREGAERSDDESWQSPVGAALESG